jgi:hypothetical protein
MESKARRRKLSRKSLAAIASTPPNFAIWLASKLRLRSVIREQKLTVAETAFEIIGTNTVERSDLIRS